MEPVDDIIAKYDDRPHIFLDLDKTNCRDIKINLFKKALDYEAAHNGYLRKKY
jgi:hypothetical protein